MREWMREARMKNGLTMLQAAERLDISEGYYCFIENGERQKSLDLTMAEKLGKLFGMSVQQIIEKEALWKESQLKMPQKS